MSSKRKTAVIIGSGIGGTAIAARLAKSGFDVTVYEKNSFSGGRLSLLHLNGHRFDQVLWYGYGLIRMTRDSLL